MSLKKIDLGFWRLFWWQIWARHMRWSHLLWLVALVFSCLAVASEPSAYPLLYAFFFIPLSYCAHCWFLAINGINVPRDRNDARELIKYCKEISSWLSFLLFVCASGFPLVLTLYFLANPYWPYVGILVGIFTLYEVVKRALMLRSMAENANG